MAITKAKREIGDRLEIRRQAFGQLHDLYVAPSPFSHGLGDEATKSPPTNFFRFEIPNRTKPTKRLLRAAAISTKVSFRIR